MVWTGEKIVGSMCGPDLVVSSELGGTGELHRPKAGWCKQLQVWFTAFADLKTDDLAGSEWEKEMIVYVCWSQNYYELSGMMWVWKEPVVDHLFLVVTEKMYSPFTQLYWNESCRVTSSSVYWCSE